MDFFTNVTIVHSVPVSVVTFIHNMQNHTAFSGCLNLKLILNFSCHCAMANYFIEA